MSSKQATTAADGGEFAANENSEGGTTMALEKKRSRRVSFAEMTSVHFFDRDDEYNEAPAEVLSKRVREDENGPNEIGEKSDLLGFRGLEDSKGEDGDGDREDGDSESEDEQPVDMRRSFLRPMESPSPGSTFGSATPNEEDNFFGPVSASFIRSGCLSDSAASDDNHDVTMDSTAFSMHFRSLARSESGADLKTPTGVHLSFEEKTPTLGNVGSSMEITVLKKPISQSSPTTANIGGCSGSSDMSLLGDNPHKYDYERISPGLDALLAAGSKDLHVVSASDNIVDSKSPGNSESKISPSKENGNGLMNGEVASSFDNKFGKANDGSPTSHVSYPASNYSPSISKALAMENLTDDSISSANRLSKLRSFLSHPDKLSPTGRCMQRESQFVELISSSPTKDRQILTSSTSPTPYMLAVTPQEQINSILRDENVKHHVSALSIQKSISKLNLLEASPFSSSLTSKIENSTLGALDFSKSSPYRTILEKGLTGYQTVPASGDEEQPLNVSHKHGQQVHAYSFVGNPIEDLDVGGHRFHTEESTAAAASLSPFFRTKSPSDIKLVTAGTDSSLTENANAYVAERKTIGTPMKFVPSTDEASEKKLISSPKLQGPLSNHLMLHNRLMKLQKFFPGHGSASKGAIIDANLSNSLIGNFDSFAMGRKILPGSPVVGFNSSNLTKVTATDDIDHHDRQGNFETIEKVRTPIKQGSEFLQLKTLDWSAQIGIDIPMFKSDHPGRESEPAASSSAARSAHRNLKELTFRKNLVDCFAQTPSKKEVQTFGNENLSPREVEDVLSPLSNKLNSLGRKRNNEVVLLEKEHTKDAAAFHRSPKVQKVGNHHLETLGCPNEDGEEACMITCELLHWTDAVLEYFSNSYSNEEIEQLTPRFALQIYAKASKDAEKLLSSPTEKLNHSVVHSLRTLQESIPIELLEDVLFNLQRSKTYAMLRNEIFAQKTSFVDGICRERVGEARLLLHQIIHEKAKLQLMCVKQQKLLERVQLLSSGVQESQKLKPNFLPKHKGDAQADGVGLQPLVNLKRRDEVVCDKVTEMKQALEALETRTTNLMKSLATSCKVKGEPSGADRITSVNEHLMKKSRCRLIRLDIQMWVVDDVKSSSSHHDIHLNYLDFITQSLKLPISPASCIVISHKLDDINITKNFPNMDACTAFSFVFNAETTRKYSGSRSLAPETQVTSSLLGNLVDVVQELQLSQIELRNLTRTTFRSPLAGQLNLHLCFFNFKSGGKVTLTLDLSCLNRGIYPSEIFPTQLTAANGAKESFTETILDEIRDAVKSLPAGYLRILRLCRRVATVIEASRH